jgi:hypothetical protein
VGPGGGVFNEQRTGGTVAGPFGATSGVTRSGSYVASSGTTAEYAQRGGSVVGPLGGVQGGSTSYVRAQSADGGVASSRYTSRSAAVGPGGGLAAGRAVAAAVGPFAAADYPLPGEAPPPPVSSAYQYERSVAGPDVGYYNEQRSGGTVAGPFGATSGATRSGSYVAPSGATVEYNQRGGAVVGPLGGGYAGSTSRVHAESADRGLTYSRYSSSGTAVGPVGPYGAVGYRRPGVIAWP